MPIVVNLPGAAGAPSGVQSLPQVTVFDYEYQPDSTPLVNGEIFVWLGHDKAMVASPQVVLESRRFRVLTDPNGYWSVSLIPNSVITPAGTYYVVRTPFRTYRIAITGGGGPFQASVNLAP